MSAVTGSDPRIVQRTEFLVVAQEPELISRAREISEFFNFNSEFFETTEGLKTASRYRTSPLVVLVSLLDYPKLEQRLEQTKKVRKLYTRSQIIVVITGEESREELEQLRIAGVQQFILHSEIHSSKFYYLCALLVQGTYLPVPVGDLFPGSPIDFNGFHKLPINQNYLPVIFAGFLFSDKKYRRLEASKQVYVKRGELNRYRKYIETYHDDRGNALKKRCRAMMLSLMGSYTELLLLLSLDAETNQKLLNSQWEQFTQTALELAECFKKCPDGWNVIAHSLEFQFTRYERGPYVIAYAMHIAQNSGMTELKDIIHAILLSDLGMLELPSSCFRQIQRRGGLMLAPADEAKYQNHPVASLNKAMARDLPMNDHLKSILVCTNERADEAGFPNRVPADQLPLESQLIQFCKLLDSRAQTALEDGIITHDFIRRQFFEEQKSTPGTFTAEFLNKIETAVVTSVA